ncbi:hypothetical protein GCM10017620_26300 [Brevundimonas intermedia]|uniref:HNH endonuclease n=1 Tax=Brevundimonas intermedia TaxID=74315 RepID=A0ABQ5TA12_9CAUL|nr:hypothetical protein [Brevundimonas intermedia]GLK49657.1 hypothetical protein GCM10017620_26300 [Brevundimonas intermedia]
MARRKFTKTDVRAGCFVCNGADPRWTGKNAMALAARHHDATGHNTWADQVLIIRYGDAADAHPDLFEEAA